jgi:hypothetical protein
MRLPWKKRSGDGGGKSEGAGGAVHEVVFHTYPKLLFIWPIIVAGFLFWPLGGWEWVDQESLGWVYLITSAVVILTIGVDIERNHAAFWLAIIGVFFFLGLWLSEKTGFTFFGNLFNFFEDLEVAYSRGFGLSMSLLLLIPYVTMIIWARLQHRWRITHNEFEHYAWGRADDSLARGAKRVRSTYPDLLELLLFGSGTLIVYSATGRSELRRIPHVPMIFLVRKRINSLLEATAVTQADTQDILAEAEEQAESDEADTSTRTEDEEGGIGGNEPL